MFLIGKIAYWQIAKGTEYQNAIQDQGYNSTVGSKIPFQRGTITDRNGVQLAYSSKTYNVILQNAETIKVVTPKGSESVTKLKKGDKILAHLTSGGRHFGMKVEETITEK